MTATHRVVLRRVSQRCRGELSHHLEQREPPVLHLGQALSDERVAEEIRDALGIG